MILRKYMSLLGIGSAKIDLILEKDAYKPGEPVYGFFKINGGTVDQQLKRIDCDLVRIDQKSGVEQVLDTATILSVTTIVADEMNEIPFSFQLPDTISASESNQSYCFHTKLHFREGVESKDEDYIQIIH